MGVHAPARIFSNKGLSKTFDREASLIPAGDRLARCLQCGTCTGSCPVSYAMDVSPRMVVALYRAGRVNEVLESRTIWMCASCYMCTTRCPQSIKLTDVLYAFKRTAMDAGLFPGRFPVYVLSETFTRLLRRYGRSPEPLLLVLYALRRNPFSLFRTLPLAFRLWRRGRVRFRPTRIKGIDTVRAMLDRCQDLRLAPPPERPAYVQGAVGYRAIG